MTFTIKRSEWFRGKGPDDSKLLDDNGKRCCWGFVANQCGIPDEQLKGKKVLRELLRDFRDKVGQFLDQFGSEVSWILTTYKINDQENLADN